MFTPEMVLNIAGWMEPSLEPLYLMSFNYIGKMT